MKGVTPGVLPEITMSLCCASEPLEFCDEYPPAGLRLHPNIARLRESANPILSRVSADLSTTQMPPGNSGRFDDFCAVATTTPLFKKSSQLCEVAGEKCRARGNNGGRDR